MLIVHLYVVRLTHNKKSMLIDMTNSSVKPINIVLTIKKHNEKNVTIIKEVYNVRYAYCRLD